MSGIKRRDFIKLTGAAAVAGASLGFPSIVLGASRRVVIVGGGVGGCTAAKYLRRFDPNVEVILIEGEPKYHSCFLSNEYISGEREMASLTFGYDGLKKYGISIVHDWVLGIDPEKRTVRTKGGHTFAYDRCIVSPGVDFKWDAIEGYSAKMSDRVTHAWFGGPQTVTLRKQIESMPDGGLVAIVAPPNPFKCPPGPYERASQIAMYFKYHKPRSKVMILDFKDAFTKQDLFIQGWSRLYGYGTDYSMIEWVSAAAGGKVEALDAKTGTLRGEFTDVTADVVNIIPPQKAGKIAFEADLVDKDWCPVDKKTFESSRHAGIYVLGDACDAAHMPKSAYAANSQAKVCVAALIASLDGRAAPQEPSYVNTCYSILGEAYGISVAGVYKLDEARNMIVGIEGAGGLTPMDSLPRYLKREVTYAHSWFDNLISDMLG